MTLPLETQPLSDALGVEIRGLDTRRPPDEPMAETLRTALDRHQLLLFRDQTLDVDAQIALGECFGPPLVENDNGQRFQFVSNVREDGILGDGRFAYHSDHAFMEQPIDVISLYGLEAPKGCGRTHFTNALRAGSELPDELRSRVAGLRARHIIDPEADSETVVARGHPLSDALPHSLHPILWPHPRTGDPVLYVNEQQTDSIEGLDETEGRGLIEALFAHLYSPRYVYVHEWQEGDLVLWDNRALQHARDALGREIPRTLRRVSIGGTSVIEFFRKRDGRVVKSNEYELSSR